MAGATLTGGANRFSDLLSSFSNRLSFRRVACNARRDLAEMKTSIEGFDPGSE
jgi:hypothetical protein